MLLWWGTESEEDSETGAAQEPQVRLGPIWVESAAGAGGATDPTEQSAARPRIALIGQSGGTGQSVGTYSSVL